MYWNQNDFSAAVNSRRFPWNKQCQRDATPGYNGHQASGPKHRTGNLNLTWELQGIQSLPWQGSLLISKLEFFYQGWFPRFGFFISRPYAVFYTIKVVFFIKECTFYSFQLFLKLKQWFYHFLSVWQVVVRCNFGFWPLGRVGFEVTFNLIRPVLSFLSNWLSFLSNCWKLEYFKGREPPRKMSDRDPCFVVAFC